MTIDRPSRAIHPRFEKSINALFTVSRDEPTSWASSSCVRSCGTFRPASTGSPNRDARSSNVLAKRAGTSMNTRSVMRSLLLRIRFANTCNMSTATRGYLSSHANNASCSSHTTRVPFTIATAEAVRGPPFGSNTGISPSTSPRAWMLSSCTRPSLDSRVSFTRPFSSKPMRWSVSPCVKMCSPLSYTDSWSVGSSSSACSGETCLNNAVCSNVFSSLGIAFGVAIASRSSCPLLCRLTISPMVCRRRLSSFALPNIVAPSAHPTHVNWSTVEKARTGRHARPPSPTVEKAAENGQSARISQQLRS